MWTKTGLDKKIRTRWGQELDFLRQRVVNNKTRTNLGQYWDKSWTVVG